MVANIVSLKGENMCYVQKLIDKMINADFIEKTGEGNKTIYKIKE